MTTAMPLADRRIAAWGWPLIALRLAAMLALLVASVALYYAFAPFTARNPVPRQFLRGVGAIAGLRVQVRGARPPGAPSSSPITSAGWTSSPSPGAPAAPSSPMTASRRSARCAGCAK
ncbi:hypothetical protein ACFSLT_12325 [Novosphingobium resinovorum]